MPKRWACGTLLLAVMTAGLSSCGGSTVTKNSASGSAGQLTVQAGMNDPTERTGRRRDRHRRHST
jgi:hypothetical protein